jgi:hypothetical protein
MQFNEMYYTQLHYISHGALSNMMQESILETSARTTPKCSHNMCVINALVAHQRLPSKCTYVYIYFLAVALTRCQKRV